MEQQPPNDSPANLEEQVADLKTDLNEVKQLLQQLVKHIDDKFPLTHDPNHRYYDERELDNQPENSSEGSPISTNRSKPANRPNPIPYIEEGQQASCGRCGHTWVPIVRRPKQCPACRQKWYRPKAWTRTKSGVS